MELALKPNPADLGYPPTLPIEVALRTAPIKEICEAYGLSRQEWDELRCHPVFISDLREAVDMVKKEGMSFKLRARLQSDELLATSWKMIHSPLDQVPASVKADLLKFTIRCAGLDASKDQASAAAIGNALQININLG